MRIFRVNDHVALAVEMNGSPSRDLWRYRVLVDGHVIFAGADLHSSPHAEARDVAIDLAGFVGYYVEHYECSHVRRSTEAGQCHEGAGCILHILAAEHIERISRHINDLNEWAVSAPPR